MNTNEIQALRATNARLTATLDELHLAAQEFAQQVPEEMCESLSANKFEQAILDAEDIICSDASKDLDAIREAMHVLDHFASKGYECSIIGQQDSAKALAAMRERFGDVS